MDLSDDNLYIDNLSKVIHQANVDKGFWPLNKKDRNKSEVLMLTVGELAESQEALRDNNFCTLTNEEKNILFDLKDSDSEAFKDMFKATVKDTFQDEMIDVLIRQLDAIQGFDIDLLFHLRMKLHYNSLRPHKHGKVF